MKKTAKRWTLISMAGVLLTIFAIITGADGVVETVDPYIYTEAEADDAHQKIKTASEHGQQTQAGFNAYTLKQLMYQEILVLELQIKVETDPDRLEVLKITLGAKRQFVRDLEEEERRQLLRKGEF